MLIKYHCKNGEKIWKWNLKYIRNEVKFYVYNTILLKSLKPWGINFIKKKRLGSTYKSYFIASFISKLYIGNDLVSKRTPYFIRCGNGNKNMRLQYVIITKICGLTFVL